MALEKLAWRMAPWDQPASQDQLVDDYHRIGYQMGIAAGRRESQASGLQQ
jgi:hypothetical protein